MWLRSDRIGQVRRLLTLLVVAVVAGAGACGGPTPAGEADQYTQAGVSMEPTVRAGQVITVRSVGPEYTPRLGDIVLFHAGGGQWGESTAPFLKRVIAIGGETIACCDSAGKMTVDGTPLVEPYVVSDAALDVPPNPYSCASRRFGPVAVAKGDVFVMGDNRAMSNDSRCAGPIPATSVFAVMIS
jgi:signal peptidase I